MQDQLTNRPLLQSDESKLNSCLDLFRKGNGQFPCLDLLTLNKNTRDWFLSIHYFWLSNVDLSKSKKQGNLA
jgi:hypothetical protein